MNEAQAIERMKGSRFIAFIGVAGTGKDELALGIAQQGQRWQLLPYGTTIKAFFDNYTKGTESRHELLRRLRTEGQQGAEDASPHLEGGTINESRLEADIRAFEREILEPYEAGGWRISSFTEDRTEKPIVRPVLEHGGDLIIPWSCERYFKEAEQLLRDRRLINTRVGRLHETKRIHALGGMVVEVTRPGKVPETKWEHECIEGLRAAGEIDATLENGGTLEAWQALGRSIGAKG